jgi:carboxyl-terminal processing protease
MRQLALILVLSIAAFVVADQSTRTADLNRKTFEKVWRTVNEKFYDPTFLGVDWKRAHDEYLPVAIKAVTDDEFYKVINEMLGLIKVSHLQARSDPATEKQSRQTPGVTGLRLRDVDGKVTVFQSLPGLPAANAGILRGYVITAVDGAVPADTKATSRALAGPAGTRVNVRYLDGHDRENEVVLTRQALSDTGKIAGLAAYTLFDSRILDGGIGYIWFSSFVESLNGRLSAAIDSMRDAPGLIIDLRGNSGGDDAVGISLADKLIEKETQLMLVKTRNGVNRDIKAHGNNRAYPGKVVLLVDEFSASAAEDFSAGLQEAGRAYVIGKRTLGEDLDADIAELPDGGILIYPFGLTTTPKGVVVEGRGVTPDLTVTLQRQDLLAGRDTQVQAAIDFLRAAKK